MRVIGLLLFVIGCLSDEGEWLSSIFFGGSNGNYSLYLWILVKPKFKDGKVGLSSFSSTICSRFNCPIMVSSGCSASEKKGLRYLFFYISFSTQKIV